MALNQRESGATGIVWHVGERECGECYAVADFGSADELSRAAEALGFDEFNDCEIMDSNGFVSASDGGLPFKSRLDICERLKRAFPGSELLWYEGGVPR